MFHLNKNQIKIGYNSNNQFNYLRQTAEDRFIVEYSKVKRDVRSFRKECLYAAQDIYDEFKNQELNLFLSGGIESEILAYVFHINKIPFKPIIGIWNNEDNLYDVKYIIQFLDKLDIKYYKVHLDIQKFLENDLDFADKSHCPVPGYLIYTKLISETSGVPILGMGDSHLVKQDNQWFFEDTEDHGSMIRYGLINNRPMVPYFYMWNSEIILSYLNDEYIIDLTNNEFTMNDSLRLKNYIYQKYFNMQYRPKYSGFEKYFKTDYWQNAKNYLSQKYSNDKQLIKINDIRTILGG